MKKQRENLEEIKSKIASLKGVDLTFSINRGRKRFEVFNGKIESVYSSVFTIKTVDQPKQSAIQTFSYFDVMCGDVTFVKDVVT